MRYAQIKNNEVVNVIEADTLEEAVSLSPDYTVYQSNKVNIGWYYTGKEVKEYTAPSYNKYTHTLNTLKDEKGLPLFSIIPLPEEQLREKLILFKIEIRAQRNRLLSETDWTANSDVAMSAEMATYRQALRDLPETVDIDNPVFPDKPII